MKKIKGGAALFLILLLISSFASCSTAEEHMQKRFDRMLQKSFVTEMESDYMTCHFYLESPEKQGVKQKNIEVSLGFRPTEEAFQKIRESIAAEETEWNKIDRSKLTAKQQDTYDLLYFQFTAMKTLYQKKFDKYHPYFNLNTGPLAKLPTLLMEFPVRSEQDLKDFILLLRDSKDYISAYMSYMEQQLEAGTLLADLPACAEFYSGIGEQGEESAFLEELLEKVSAVSFTAGQGEQYKNEIRDAYRSFYLEGYSAAAQRAQAIAAEAHPMSYAAVTDGAEYYEALLQFQLGTSKTVPELKKGLETVFALKLAEALKTGMENPESLNDISSEDFVTPYNSYQEAVTALQKAVQADFPEIGQVNYTLEEIPSNVAGEHIAAYFLTPAIDSQSPRVIRVNPSSNDASPSEIANFITLAHESFPGHLYQNQYAAQRFKEQPWRLAFCNWQGYTEGYATYVGINALSYLPLDPTALELYKNQEAASFCMIALAEIGLHYEGWSAEEQAAFLQKYHVDEAAGKRVYQAISAMPGTYMNYYAGLSEFINLEWKTKKALEGRFNALAFHAVLLESGCVTFDLLEKKVDAYIKEASQELVNSVAA